MRKFDHLTCQFRDIVVVGGWQRLTPLTFQVVSCQSRGGVHYLRESLTT